MKNLKLKIIQDLILKKRRTSNFGDLKYKTYTEEFDEIIKAEDLRK